LAIILFVDLIAIYLLASIGINDNSQFINYIYTTYYYRQHYNIFIKLIW